MASIKRYVLVEQTGAAVTVHARAAAEPWATEVLGPSDAVALPEGGIELPVDAIYEDVVFEGNPT